MGNKDPNLSRRTVLKSSAALAATPLLVTGSAGATYRDRKRFRAHAEQSFRIEEQHGTDAMIDFMRDKGYTAASRGAEFDLGDDDVSTEQLDDPEGAGLDLSVAGYYDSWTGEYQISLGGNLYLDVNLTTSNYTCYPNVFYSYGSDPNDGAALRWNTSQDVYWEPVADDSASDFVYTYGEFEWDDGSYDGDGNGYRIDDKKVSDDWIDSLDDEWGCEPGTGRYSEYVYAGRGGVYLEPVGNHDSSDREVWGAYTHAWSTSTTDLGLSFGYPPGVSISLTPDSEVDQEDTQTEKDGDTFLKIAQDEVVTNCC